KTERPDGAGAARYGRAKRPPGEIVLDADIRRGDVGIDPPLTMAGEIVGGPFPRRREIPLAIGIGAGDAEERLEAGRLPQILGPRRFPRVRNHETPDGPPDAE